MKQSSYVASLTKIAKDTSITGLGELFYVVVAYAISFIISRFLGAQGMGIYAQATTVLLLASLLARSGFEGGILRFVSVYLARRDYARVDGITFFATRLVFITGIVCGGILFVGADVLANEVWHEPQLASILRGFALIVPFSALLNLWLSGIQALQRIKYRVYLERGLLPLATLALIAILLLLGWGWLGVTISVLLPVMVGAIVAGYVYRSLRKSLTAAKREKPKLEIKEWVHFSYPLLLSGILAFVIARMATLLLGYFRDSGEVGIYDVALRIALMVELPLAVSNVVFAPLIGGMHAKGDLNSLQTLFKIITKWIFTASLLVFLVAIFLAKPILGVFGSEFTAGVPVLFILAVSQLINASTGAVGWVLIMSGYSTLHLLNSVLSALLIIILSLALMPSYGMIGAAIAVGSVLVLVNVVRLAQVFYLLRIHPYRWDFIKPLTAGLITLGAVYLLQEQVIKRIHPSFWAYAITVGAILVIYLASLILFQLRQEEKELLNWAFQKVNIT